MFRTLSSTVDPIEVSEKPEQDDEVTPECAHSIKSSGSSQTDVDAVERASVQVAGKLSGNEKGSARPSLDLTRTRTNASAVLSRVFTTRSITDPGPPPDGGIKAWTQVAMAWLVILTSWGWVNSYGAFQAYYTLTLDVSPSTISWIGTVQNFCTFFFGAFSGRLLDAGLYVPTLIVGATVQVIGIFLMSLSTKYWQLMLTQGILTGLGNGIFFTPSMGLIATYFSDNRALAVGIATTGNSVGGIIYPLVVRELLPKVGFPWTCRVLGFINLAMLALAICFMRPRLPPRKSGPVIDWSAFTEAPYVFFLGTFFFQVWSIYYTFYYLGSFGVEAIGLPFSQSTILIILINGIGVPARIIPGYIADRCGQLNTMLPIVGGLTIVAWSWLAVHDVTGLYIFTCFYGLFSAAFQCLIPPTVASLTTDLKMVGTRLGMVFTCISFAALTGPPLGGAIQSAQGGSFVGAQAWSAAAAIISFVFVIFARMARTGWKLHGRA